MKAMTTSLLSQTPFSSTTLQFSQEGFTGYLEVTQELRETYFQNVVGQVEYREQNCEAIADMPDGVVEVHSVRVGNEERLVMHSVSGDDVAGTLEFGLDMATSDEGQLLVKVTPYDLMVEPEFMGEGHVLDLLSAACWLVQDIVAGLFENEAVAEHSSIGLGVCCSGENPVVMDMAQAFAATLAVTGEAMCADHSLAKNEDFYLHFKQAA